MLSRAPGSLRMRLFLAIGLIVVLSVGLTLGVGVMLTHRAVERATLQDVSHQADLLAGRERLALLPFAHLHGLRPFLARQRESVVAAPLDRASDYLSERDLRGLHARGHVEGTVRVHGEDWFFGERYGVLDPYAFLMCRWTRGFGRPARSLPHLGPYLNRMLARPAVKRVFEKEKLPLPYV